MPKRNLIDELRARGAVVDRLSESTRHTAKYRVRLPGRPEMRVTDQYFGGWKVSLGGRAYGTYSVPMTLAFVLGEPLSAELLTGAQRAALALVEQAGEDGLESRKIVYRQLYSLGFLVRAGKDRWRLPPNQVA